MADEKPAPGQGAGASGSGKRPHAVLDLKATEIKVTPIASKSQAASPETSAAGNEADVPRPAPARSYGAAGSERNEPASEQKMQGEAPKQNGKPPGAGATATNSGDRKAAGTGGGFFSHLAAGIVGGVLAYGAAQWAVPQFGPQFGIDGGAPPFPDDRAAISERLAALEKNQKQDASAPDLSAVEGRIAALEKTAQKIPALSESQSRLVAETKAALASAASDAGAPQLIERLGKVEDKLKALADAGANDPNSGRVAQLAALTGKVADLETSLSTQLSALRTSVAKDVEGRIQGATEASETARSGTQRIDKDVAGLKSDAVRLEERIAALKDANDHVAADLKLAQEEAANLKTSFETLKTTVAKPADIAAAVAPLNERTAALEKSVQDVAQADAARKESSERVVLALELQNLRRVLDSGQAFSTQLADVKKVAGTRVDLAALTRLQDTGVPTLADLTKDFRTAADSAIDADAEPENAGVVDRLWAGAKSVVRVRRIDLKPDDKSAEATVGRMQVALNDGRLSDVLDAAKDLSPKAQDAARSFLDKVAARVSVDTALAGLESELKSSIATGAPPQQSKPVP